MASDTKTKPLWQAIRDGDEIADPFLRRKIQAGLAGQKPPTARLTGQAPDLAERLSAVPFGLPGILFPRETAGLAEQFSAGALETAGRAVEGIGKFGERALNALPMDRLGLDDRTRAARMRSVEAAGEPGRKLQEMAGEAPAPSGYVQALARGAGATAPFMAAPLAGPAALPAMMGGAAASGVEDAYTRTLEATGDEAKAVQAAAVQIPVEALLLAPVVRVMGRLGGSAGGSFLRNAIDGAVSGTLGPGSARILGEVASEQITKGEKADLAAALQRGGGMALQEAAVSAPLFAFLHAAAGLRAPMPKAEARPEAAGAGGLVPSKAAPEPFSARPVETFQEPARPPVEAQAGPEALPDLPDEARRIVYHGTPHSFEKFDISKIGTGEGAQAFGHGLYFTDKKEIAEHYRNKLTAPQRTIQEKAKDAYDSDYSPDEALAELIGQGKLTPNERALVDALNADGWLGFDYPHQAVNAALGREAKNFDLSPETQRAIEAVKADQAKAGALHEVALAPKESELLDWDKPLSEQSEKVKAAFRGEAGEPLRKAYGEGWERVPGNLAYARLGESFGAQGYEPGGKKAHELASEILRAAGIRGIKYLEGQSRHIAGGNVEALPAERAGYGAMRGAWVVRTRRADGTTHGERFFDTQVEAEAFSKEQQRELRGSHNYVIFSDADVEILKPVPSAPAVEALPPSKPPAQTAKDYHARLLENGRRLDAGEITEAEWNAEQKNIWNEVGQAGGDLQYRVTRMILGQEPGAEPPRKATSPSKPPPAPEEGTQVKAPVSAKPASSPPVAEAVEPQGGKGPKAPGLTRKKPPAGGKRGAVDMFGALEQKRYRYRMMYRPPSFETLPKGLKYEVEPPTREAPFGVISTEKPIRFADEEAFQLEPLDPNHPKNIRRTVEQRRSRLADSLSDQDTIEAVDARGGVKFFGPDTRRPDKFRLTSIDERGEPTGHIELGDLGEALDEIARMGIEPKGLDIKRPPHSPERGALDIFGPRKAAQKSPDGGDGFDVPDQTRADRLYTGFVNDLERIVQIEKAAPKKARSVTGESIEEALSLFPGRKFHEGQKMDEQLVRPLTDILKTIPHEKAGDFLQALHVPDALKELGEKAASGTSVKESVGMTLAEAQKITSEALSGPHAEQYRKLQEWNKQANRAALDILESGSLISKETRAEWERRFGENFVHLKSIPDDLAREVFGPSGFQVSGKESKTRKGRESKAGNPIAFRLMSLQEAISRKERNRVGNLLGDLVRQNPKPELWRIETDRNKVHESEYALSFKENGEQRYIVTKDKGLADAFKRIQEPEPGAVALLDPLNKWLHSVIIKWNPVFPLYNVPKDIGTAGLKQVMRGDMKGALSTVTGSIPAAKGVFAEIRKPGSGGEWGKRYRELREAGGVVGWNEQYSFEERIKAFEQATNPQGRARAFFQLMDDLNRAAEVGTRVAAFDAFKKAGMPTPRAAMEARRITADFSRRGRWAPIYRRLYLFSGANIQGSSEIARAIRRNPNRSAAVLGSLIGAGYMNAALSDLFGDPEALEKLTEDEKARYFGVMVGKKRIGLPAAYGFNAFSYLGHKIYDISKGEDPAKALGEAFSATLESFSPLPRGANVIQQATPSALRPAVEIAQNRNFANVPIAPEPSPYDPNPPPQHERYFKGVSAVSKEITQGLSNIGIDISPEVLDHLAGAATGGLGQFGLRAQENIRRVVSGDTEGMRLQDIPLAGELVRPFVREAPESATSSLFWKTLKRVEEIEAKVKDGDAKAADYKAEMRTAAALKAFEKPMRTLRTAIKNAKTDETREKLEARLRSLQEQFLERARANGMQLSVD